MAGSTEFMRISYILKTIIFICLLSIFSVSGYAQTKIRVAVAASLMLPMEDIKQAFEKENPEIQIELIGGSSGNLTTQIKNGAPFHIFLSANWAYPLDLYHQGFSNQNPQIITHGKMVIWTKSKITENNLLNLFLNENTKAIAIANPKLAPYGWTAKKWLESKGIWGNIERKLIYGQSISQVNQYIYSGNVEVAFTAVSAKNSDKFNGNGNWFTIENEAFQVPNGGIILKFEEEKNQKPVTHFFTYLLEDTSVKIFQHYGYAKNGKPK